MKALLCASLCLLNLCAALPEAGVVVQGQANIASNGVDMIITQTTERATIEWSKFNVGAQNSVRFQQPSSSSIALNRVTGTELSKIAGKITANGQVVLINPNGVIFAKGSTVNVGGLLASSYQMNQTNADTYELQKNSSKVLNEGDITADKDVILLGTQVENSGNIKAHGKVVLSGDNESETFYLTDGNLQFQVAKNMLPTDGSAIPLTNLVTSSVNHTGIIEAGDITTNISGEVILCGADETNISGRVSSPGGKIHIAGNAIELTNATIDVSSENQGGTINVGGGFQGAKLNDKKNSTKISVDQNSKLTANSTDGDAGKVIMWSEAATYFAGQASANAKNKNRNGGLIEVSSKGQLGMPRTAKISAEGRNGSVLFDPGTLRVVPGFGAADDGLLPNVNAVNPNNYAISAVALLMVGGGNITLQADDTIDLSAVGMIALQPGVNLIMTSNILNGSNTTISTQGDITINAPGGSEVASLATINGGNITVNGPINNGASPLMMTTDFGDITLNGAVTTTNQDVTLQSNSGNITNQAINAGTGLVTRTTNLPGVLTPPNAVPVPPAPPAVTPNNPTSQFDSPTQQEAFNDSTQTFQQVFNLVNKSASQNTSNFANNNFSKSEQSSSQSSKNKSQSNDSAIKSDNNAQNTSDNNQDKVKENSAAENSKNEEESASEDQPGGDEIGSLSADETTTDEKNSGNANHASKCINVNNGQAISRLQSIDSGVVKTDILSRSSIGYFNRNIERLGGKGTNRTTM
jgi:filamentous hemagglutinin family protein